MPTTMREHVSLTIRPVVVENLAESERTGIRCYDRTDQVEVILQGTEDALRPYIQAVEKVMADG